jgi:2-polyprenyl-3-methyl-5-hydroxy-6-metoxy-1,4-benzoquinol methylase
MRELDRILLDELDTLESATDRHYQWVYDIIAPSLGRSILEVGSGTGVISKFLVGRGHPVILSDHQAIFIDRLRKRFGHLPFVSYRILDLTHEHYDLGGRQIDTILCLNVLEHLEDDITVLRGFWRLLPSGGALLLQVPNYGALLGSLDEAYAHYRRYTRKSITARLDDAGFRVVWIRNFNPFSIPGWILSAKIFRVRRLNPSWLRFYNNLVPLLRRLDFLSKLGGLSLILHAEKGPSTLK